MENELLNQADALGPKLSEWRRELHRRAEVGMCLPNTSAYVQRELTAMGVPFETLLDGSCVVAKLGRGEKCILLRGDMDALSIPEGSGESFASKNGCMHACGHDMHAATLLGAAQLLKLHEGELGGCVKLIFQPGEEIFEGARAAIKAGVLKDPPVGAAFGMHVVPNMDEGVGAVCIMSSVYGFEIEIAGKGGHGATPSVCIDPIAAGVQIHAGLQELMARECPTPNEAVLTIGRFTSGDAPNVIPDRAILSGTLRTFDDAVAERLIGRIRDMAEGIGKAYRVEIEVRELFCGPVLRSEAHMMALSEECAKECGLVERVVENFKAAGSEDFAYFAQEVPAAFISYGTPAPGVETRYPPHHPKVRFGERLLPRAAATYACVALRWLNEKSEIDCPSAG